MTRQKEVSDPLQRRVGIGFTLAAWAVLLVMLAWLAHGFLQRERNPNAEPQSRQAPGGGREVVLQRNREGHYLATGSINGRAVTFLLDTGATLVAVDERLATRLGLAKGPRRRMQTANGAVDGWQTLLKTVEIGGLVQHAVPAVIMPRLGDDVLLGMSFLKRVEMIQRDGTLILRDPA